MENTNTTVKKERIMGLDVFRILAMCGIVGLHVMNSGGIMNSAELQTVRYPVLLTLLTIFFLSVNSFALLSGYLLIEKKKHSSKRIIELLAIVLFFVVVMTAIFYAFNIGGVRSSGIMTLLKSLFPFGFGFYWYITCYVFLFFMMPFLNRFVASIERRTYKRMLIIIGILLSVIPNLFMQTDFFHIDDGYSPFWLIFCYLVGGYLRMYPPKIKTKKCVMRAVLAIVLMVALNYAWRIFAVKVFGQEARSSWIISYTSPLNLYASAMLLIVFSRVLRELKSRTLRRAIMALSAAAFSVYIVHDQYLFYSTVLEGNFVFTNGLNIPLQIVVVVGAIGAIYVLGTVAELIRKPIFRFLKIDNLVTKIGDKIDGKSEKIENEN